MKKKVIRIDVGKLSRKEAIELIKKMRYWLKHKKGKPIEPRYFFSHDTLWDGEPK